MPCANLAQAVVDLLRVLIHTANVPDARKADGHRRYRCHPDQHQRRALLAGVPAPDRRCPRKGHAWPRLSGAAAGAEFGAAMITIGLHFPPYDDERLAVAILVCKAGRGDDDDATDDDQQRIATVLAMPDDAFLSSTLLDFLDRNAAAYLDLLGAIRRREYQKSLH